MANNEKLIFPIGFDLEEGVRQVQKDWKKHQPEIQKTIDRNPLKLKLELSAKGFNISELKKYIGLSKEIANANREIAKTRSANALAAQRESRQRVQEATELDQIKQKKAQAALTEERLTQAKQRSANATERQNSAYKTQGGYLSRLFQRMVAYASIAQAFSFVRNVRDTTAEFELQRVALGSIIGDMNEANKLFEQIKAAAVKSPFQIKELVTYTKQLAAYKIEQEELFETTQRLADISAGLGVSMDRLVLAYGQIRATGYLRASEVRQLTEAGIPIVEALAEKMSQLRDETVSAAEVMGMISERAISFGMVKEVFDDMTSAGGMFYKMQEKQAETLAGQWSNLQDAISIMYEEIGNTEGVNNSIKGTIGLIKSLAENWRDVYSVAQSLSVATVVYYVAMKNATVASKALSVAEATRLSTLKATTIYMPKFLASTKLATTLTHAYRVAVIKSATATGVLSKAFWGLTKAMLSNPYTAVLAALAGLATLLLTVESRAKRLNKELAKIGTEGALQTDQSVRNFERLAKVIRESTDGSREQSEALAELKRTYGDLLPTQDAEIKALVQVKEGYEDVTRAIREKINAQIYEQKMNTIISDFSTNIANKQKKPKKWLENMGFSAEETTRIFNAIDKAVQDGLIKVEDDVVTQARKIEKIIKDQTGKVVNLTESQYARVAGTNQTIYQGEKATRLSNRLSDLVQVYSDFNNSVNELANSQKRASNITWEYQEGYDNLKESIADTNAQFDASTFAGQEAIRSNTLEKWREYFVSLSDIFAQTSEGGVIDFESLEDEIEKLPASLRAHIRVVQKEYEKLIPTGIDQLIREKFQDIAKEMGLSMDLFKNYFKASDKSTKDWAKGIESSIESLQLKLSDLNKLQDQSKAGWAKGETIWRDYSEEIKNTTDTMSGLQLMLEFFKDILSPEGGGKKTNPRIALLNEELSTVEKIYKEYQELCKFMSEDDARARVADMFEGVNLTMLSQALSPTEMRAQLQKALDEAKNMGDKKQILELEYKLGKFNVDEEQRELEKSLKDLSDKISRTKTAKEFFDRMLGLTGDKQLSATLTLSVYGTTGDDLQRLMSKQVEDAFKNLPEGFDITKAMLGGGKFDYNLLESWIEKLPEQDRKSAQSIVENWRKTNQDIITDLYKTYEEFLSFEERKTRVVEKENAERMRIINSGLPMAEQEKLIGASQKRENKALADIAIEEFKASADWAKSFEDLEHLATPTIERLMAKLKEFIDTQKDLTPEQLKTLTNEYKKLYDGLIARNPFKAMTDGIKEYVAATKDVKTAKDRVETAQEELRIATERKAAAEQNFKTSQDVATAGREYASAIKEYNKASQNAADADKDLGDSLDAQKTALNKTVQGFNAASSAISNFGSIITDITEILGIAEDSEVGAFIKDLVKWLGVMASVLGTVAAIIAVIEAELAPLLAIAAGIAAIGAAISFFSNAKVRKANKEIERQQDLIDKLEKSHERLEKQIEKTFGSDYLKNYNDRLANLYAQQEAYLKQAEAERSKGKKEDEEKTQGYLDSASDVAEQIADMQKEVSERFLGTDLASTARDFAQSWIDAYKEFGSTTDAMKEKFHDMIQNMVVESIAGKMMQELLRPVFEDIEKYAKDGNLDEREIADIADMSIGLIDAMDEGMTGIVERLRAAGYDIRQSTSGLTGISKDIASASEESILGLAAGINTQNFYISQVPPKLDTIIALLQGGGVQVGGGVNMQDLITIQNQHLSHLPSIAQHTADTVAECKQIVAETRRTADALERVIKPRGTQATHTVNTSL